MTAPQEQAKKHGVQHVQEHATEPAIHPVPNGASATQRALQRSVEVGPPLWLLAELTYRCPLQCPYCSNPLDFSQQGAELSTA